MQAKLRLRTAADPGRRCDDPFNFVHDPATLYRWRTAGSRGNRGANTPGVDGMTVRLVEERIGVQEFLDNLRAQLKAGKLVLEPIFEADFEPVSYEFRPLPGYRRLALGRCRSKM
jgi:RNA-directed DNA polymerase